MVSHNVDVGVGARLTQRHKRVLDHPLVLDVDHVARCLAIATAADVVEAGGKGLHGAGPAVLRQHEGQLRVVVEERHGGARRVEGPGHARAVRVQQAADNP